MRYRVTLLEYNRDITAEKYGRKLVQRFLTDKGVAFPNYSQNNQRSAADVREYGEPTQYSPEALAAAERLIDVQFDFMDSTYEELAAAIEHPTPPKEVAGFAYGGLPYNSMDEVVKDILIAIEQRDPTPTKEYTPWMTRVYIAGGIHLEDLNRNDLIALHAAYRTPQQRKHLKPEHRDINTFKTYKDFEDVMETYPDITPKAPLAKGERVEVYKDQTVRVISPKNRDAACYYGQTTRWCTAATKAMNLFNDYNTRGVLYIFIPTSTSYQNEKYQLFIPKAQSKTEKIDIRDDKDIIVPYDTFAAKFPEAIAALKRKNPTIRYHLTAPIVQQTQQGPLN